MSRGFAALNPYYMLFGSALLRPCFVFGGIPLFATTRFAPVELGLAVARLAWMCLGAVRNLCAGWL